MAGKKKNTKEVSTTNKTANLGGRPAFFNTPEELQEAIESYFQIPTVGFLLVDGEKVKDKTGQYIVEYHPHTITHLAYHLGFESRQSFYDYAKRKGFSYIIARARTRIESEREQDLCGGRNVDGNKFYLSNMGGWRAEQETKQHINISAESASSFSVKQFLDKFNVGK